MTLILNCIGCGSVDLSPLGSLGKVPSCNHFEQTYEKAVNLPKHELNLIKCQSCELVQLGTHLPYFEMFGDDYPYFSSLSSGWLEHCRTAADHYKEILNVSEVSRVLEIGSNDGYMLQNFLYCRNIIGVEPSSSAASVAIAKGIDTIVSYFDDGLASQIVEDYGSFDLILSNNMMAHTPNLQAVLRGVKLALADKGTFVTEVQYATEMFGAGKYDTVYHEHFCYFTLRSACEVFRRNGLNIYDVEMIETHGGSIRVYADHGQKFITTRLELLLENEDKIISGVTLFDNFFEQANTSREEVLKFLNKNGPIVAYGAPTKGNVFMNFCGLTNDHIEFTCDLSPLKQGRFCPGSGVKILPFNAELYSGKSNVILLPWNIKNEIVQQFNSYGILTPSFFTAVPSLMKVIS